MELRVGRSSGLPASRERTRHDERVYVDLRSSPFPATSSSSSSSGRKYVICDWSHSPLKTAIESIPFFGEISFGRRATWSVSCVCSLASVSLPTLTRASASLLLFFLLQFVLLLSLSLSSGARKCARTGRPVEENMCYETISRRGPLRALADRSHVLPAGRATVEPDDGFLAHLSFPLPTRVVFIFAANTSRTISRLSVGRVVDKTTRPFRTLLRHSTILLAGARQRSSPLPSSTPAPLPPCRPSLPFLLLPGTISFALRVPRLAVREADLASWIIRMHQIVHDREDRARGVDTQGDPPE